MTLAHAGMAVVVADHRLQAWSVEIETVRRAAVGSPAYVALDRSRTRRRLRRDPRRLRRSRAIKLIATAPQPFFRSKGTQTDVVFHLLSDVYAVISDPDARTATRAAHYSPLGAVIWLGAAVMAFGGLVSLSDTATASACRAAPGADTVVARRPP